MEQLEGKIGSERVNLTEIIMICEIIPYHCMKHEIQLLKNQQNHGEMKGCR